MSEKKKVEIAGFKIPNEFIRTVNGSAKGLKKKFQIMKVRDNKI